MTIEEENTTKDYANWKAPERESNMEKSEKQKRWDELMDEVEQIADRLGHGVDVGIKETIAPFKTQDFPTSGSCEGHVEGEHGLPYPWVDVEVPEPEGWKDDEEKQAEWKKENLVERKKMMELLSEFYDKKNTPIDSRLVFENHGIFGAFRLQSMGAETMDLLSEGELKEKYIQYKQEMDDFTQFVKDKFFQS